MFKNNKILVFFTLVSIFNLSNYNFTSSNYKPDSNLQNTSMQKLEDAYGKDKDLLVYHLKLHNQDAKLLEKNYNLSKGDVKLLSNFIDYIYEELNPLDYNFNSDQINNKHINNKLVDLLEYFLKLNSQDKHWLKIKLDLFKNKMYLLYECLELIGHDKDKLDYHLKKIEAEIYTSINDLTTMADNVTFKTAFKNKLQKNMEFFNTYLKQLEGKRNFYMISSNYSKF